MWQRNLARLNARYLCLELISVSNTIIMDLFIPTRLSNWIIGCHANDFRLDIIEYMH